MVQDKTNKILNLSAFLLSFFVILIITSYIFLLIRRVILIIDSSLGVFGSGGFLNRDILLTSKDILANFTKVFDSIQIFALCGILIAFILILSTNKYQKNLIVVVVNFSLMVIISLIRIILIHLEPGNVFLTGSINPASLAYYDYSFFIYSTDTL
ncbi:MAG: hypothetical protein FK731_13795, partial [Asgard group archaeon]|nr:hypothetical protein [Asgard group archaeon]